MTHDNKIIAFDEQSIRRVWHNDAWYFSVIDIVEALTDSKNARDYWFKMKQRVQAEDGAELSTFCRQLKMQAPDGKMRMTDCANTESILRIIQSIPSPKAEPFKRWLAKVGYERIQEIENPELASQRAREIYKQKGYDDAWIEKRMRGIQIRDELTDEWKNRGIQDPKQFSILTAEISKAAFGMTPKEYREHKGLAKENLRDHMSDLELIFSMLGEASTTEIAKNTDAQGFNDNKKVAQKGEHIAGNARKALEKESGKKIITSDNYLNTPQKEKRLKRE